MMNVLAIFQTTRTGLLPVDLKGALEGTVKRSYGLVVTVLVENFLIEIH